MSAQKEEVPPGRNDARPEADGGGRGPAAPPQGRNRPYIGVHFRCCGVYARIYRRPEQPCYVGRCPRCLRMLRVRVGPDGTSARLFEAE